MTFRWPIAPASVAVALILGACGPDDPAATQPGAAAPSETPADTDVDAGAPVPVIASAVPEVFLGLVAAADRAHLRRAGPVLVPDGPGWSRISELGGRGPWARAKKIDGRRASQLNSIGGTLYFPIGADGGGLRDVELWLRPIARGQVVSIFVDEQPVTTMRVKAGWHRYRLPLPMEGLEPGEHSLRFWFRFTRFVGSDRSPGAFAGAQLVPKGAAPELPGDWTAPWPAGGDDQALLAGPPTGWTWYLLAPAGARLFARAAVTEGDPVDFIVRAEVDRQPPAELRRVRVAAGTEAEIEVHLDGFAGRAVRLTLDTEGESGPMSRAGWVAPRILVPGPPRAVAPPVRNLVLWVIDGLRGDRLDLGRGQAAADTPNLAMLAREGAVALDVWTGGASASDGHARLLRPAASGPNLARAMINAGRRTGLLSASSAVDPALTEDFNTRVDLRRAGEPAETGVLLGELDAWLSVRKRDPFFLYVATDDPRAPLRPSPGFQRNYDRNRPITAEVRRSEALLADRELHIAYDAQLSAADFWIGQLVARLQAQGVASETALLITGSVGNELREQGGLGDGHALVPEVFQVPLILWHPALGTRRLRPVARGGDLVDVASTALALVGAAPPANWPGHDVTGSLLNGLPFTPKPSGARLGNQVAARYGTYLLRGVGNRDLHLWQLNDTEATELEGPWPIAIRTLRDSMLDEP